MNTVPLIITCISGLCAFAFLTAGFAALLSQDQSEIDEFQRRYQELTFRGVLSLFQRWRWLRREAPPKPSQIVTHWRSRAHVRRVIYIGLVFLVIAFIFGQFASLPR